MCLAFDLANFLSPVFIEFRLPVLQETFGKINPDESCACIRRQPNPDVTVLARKPLLPVNEPLNFRLDFLQHYQAVFQTDGGSGLNAMLGM